MRNIWEIFKRDALRIRTNVIAIIAIVGITVVPCLYAWFNIAASWDPYKNTGNLKVAVASVDEGYDGQLIPIEINVGDQVLSMMRGNTQMEWIFTTKDKAVHGVRSGDYQAAHKKTSLPDISICQGRVNVPALPPCFMDLSMLSVKYYHIPGN